MGLESEIKHLNAAEAGLHVLTDAELARMQRRLLSVLTDFDAFCKQNNIEYGLIGGSVIGAVRHQGFIPWDDDIDLFMTRSNYNRLKKAVAAHPNPDYSLLNPGDEGYYCHIPRICDNRTYLRLLQSTGKGNNLFLDIFVLDNIPDNKLLRTLHGLRSTFYLFVISTMVTRQQRPELLKYGSPALRRKVNLRNALSLPFRFRSVESWIAKGTKCFSKYPSENTKYVVSATGGGHYFHEIYLRDQMCSYIDLPFEGRRFPAMKGYDHFISLRYGPDYMTPPPADQQEHHAVIGLNLDGPEPQNTSKELLP